MRVEDVHFCAGGDLVSGLAQQVRSGVAEVNEKPFSTGHRADAPLKLLSIDTSQVLLVPSHPKPGCEFRLMSEDGHSDELSLPPLLSLLKVSLKL